jgi:hypothetical protein
MSSIVATNEAVLQSLGLSAKGQNITEVTLTLKPDELPTALIKRVILEVPTPRYVFHKVVIEGATPTEPAPFDLDALCTRARMRLHNATEHATRDAKHHIARGFLDARIACGMPLRGSDKRHMTNDELDMFYEFHLISGIDTGLAFKRPFDNYRFNTASATT